MRIFTGMKKITKKQINKVIHPKITKTQLAIELCISRPTLDKRLKAPDLFSKLQKIILKRYGIG